MIRQIEYSVIECVRFLISQKGGGSGLLGDEIDVAIAAAVLSVGVDSATMSCRL